VPGLVDHGSQVIACDVLPRLVGWQPRLPADQPHVLLNDAEAALIGATGSEPYRNIGVVVIGTAIGAAFLVDGSPLRGASNWAGELGSLPLPAPGGVATLDRLAGGASILEALAGRDPESPEGRAVIEQAGFYLGLGLAAVIHLLNPERLVLGGGALRWPGYYQAAVRAAREHTLPDLWRACTLEASPRADTLVAYGALLAASPAQPPIPRRPESLEPSSR
jgi:predicted NBD/HSP70 family sugar kinase